MWDGISDALITFNQPNFIDEVAYIVENDVLIHAILKEIKKNSNITIKNNSKIEKIQLQRDGHTNGKVHLKSGEIYSADVLVSISFNSITFTKYHTINKNLCTHGHLILKSLNYSVPILI